MTKRFQEIISALDTKEDYPHGLECCMDSSKGRRVFLTYATPEEIEFIKAEGERKTYCGLTINPLPDHDSEGKQRVEIYYRQLDCCGALDIADCICTQCPACKQKTPEDHVCETCKTCESCCPCEL